MPQDSSTAHMSRTEAKLPKSGDTKSVADQAASPVTSQATRESLEVSAFYDCLLRAYGGTPTSRRN
jgi:hypothetical protein